MMVEVVRLLADWLSGTLTDASNADQGINVHLAAMTRDGSDAQPPDVTVVDETRNAPAARNDPGEVYPALVVGLVSVSAESTTMAPASGPRQFDVTVGFRYVVKEGLSAVGLAQAYYTAYALLRSWSYLMLPANEAKRSRNGVTIIPFSSPGAGFDMQGPMAQVDDDTVSIGWTLRLQVRRPIP